MPTLSGHYVHHYAKDARVLNATRVEDFQSPELLEFQPSNFQVNDRQVDEIVGQQWYEKCNDWILRSREQLDENSGESSISPAQQVTGSGCHNFEEKFGVQ